MAEKRRRAGAIGKAGDRPPERRIFIAEEQPPDVDERLLALDRRTEIAVYSFLAGIPSHDSISAGQYVAQVREQIERQAQGVFTIAEAAHVLAGSLVGAEAQTICDNMVHAVAAGTLRARSPGDLMPVRLDGLPGHPSEPLRTDSHVVLRRDLDMWLEGMGLPYRFPAEIGPLGSPSVLPVVEAVADDVQPLQRSKAQEMAILRQLEKMGHNPKALPLNTPGKPGVKTDVKAALKADLLFTGSTVFQKAWWRLRESGDIVDGPYPKLG